MNTQKVINKCLGKNNEQKRLWKVIGDKRGEPIEVTIHVMASNENEAINEAEKRKPNVDFFKAI